MPSLSIKSLALLACTSLAQVIINPTQLTVNDFKGPSTFQVKLATQPKSNVYLYLDTADNLLMSPCRLTFTPQNYQQPQVVSATGMPTVLDYNPKFNLPMYTWSPDETANPAVYNGKNWTLPVDRTAGQSVTGYVTGDPHFTTYDGLYYNFQGEGTYYYALSYDGQFAVQAHQYPCSGGVTCIDSVGIKYGSFVTIMSRTDYSSPVQFYTNSNPSASFIKVVQNANAMTYSVELPDGSNIYIACGNWGAHGYMNINIQLSAFMVGKVAGLTGTFDNDKNAQTQLKMDGTSILMNTQTNIDAFATSYAVPSQYLLSTTNSPKQPVLQNVANTIPQVSADANVCTIPSAQDFQNALNSGNNALNGLLNGGNGGNGGNGLGGLFGGLGNTNNGNNGLGGLGGLLGGLFGGNTGNNGQSNVPSGINGQNGNNGQSNVPSGINGQNGNGGQGNNGNTQGNTGTVNPNNVPSGSGNLCGICDSAVTTIQGTFNRMPTSPILVNDTAPFSSPLTPAAQQSAQTMCNQAFVNPNCNSLISPADYQAACKTDVLTSGSLKFINSILLTYNQQCTQKRAAVLLQQGIPDALSQAYDAMNQCPNNCGGNGICNQGACICANGYTGTSCQTTDQSFAANPTACLQKLGLLTQTSTTGTPSVGTPAFNMPTISMPTFGSSNFNSILSQMN